MKAKDLLDLYEVSLKNNRQRGITSAIAQTVKKVDGVLVVANEQLANIYKERFGVDTRIPTEISLRGITKPIFFEEHFLLQLMKHLLIESQEDYIRNLIIKIVESK